MFTIIGYIDFDYGVEIRGELTGRSSASTVRFEASGYADAQDWRADFCITRIYFQASPEIDLTRFLNEETIATIEVAVEKRLAEDEAERKLAPVHEEVI